MNYVRELIVQYKHKKAVTQIKGPEDAAYFIRKCLPNNSQEHCIALYLDGANQIIAYSVLSSGTQNASQIHPREIFQKAVLAGACYLIFAHNHPSQTLTPSKEDQAVTQKLRDAGELLQIKLIDSLIITDHDFHSLMT